MTDAAAMEARLRGSFAKQGLMQLFGASITRIAPGQVEISLAPKPELSQQHGFVHGGALTAIADSAAGSLFPYTTLFRSSEERRVGKECNLKVPRLH